MALLQRRSPATIRQVVSIATGGRGISVQFRGNQAYTDGSKIVLPAMLTPAAEELAVPYAWHESFHIEETDFKAWELFQPEFKALPILHGILNSIEDGRIEVAKRHEYPGVHPRINALIAALRDREKRTLFSAPDKLEKPANALLGYVLNWTRSEVNGYSAIQYLAEWRQALVNLVGEDLVNKIDAVLDANRSLKDTSDAMRAAREVLDVLDLNEDSDDDSDSSGSGQGEDEDSGDDSDGSGSGQGEDEDSDDDSDSSGSGQGEDEDSDDDSDGSGSGQERADAVRSIKEASEDDLGATDLGDIASEAINGEQKKSPGGLSGGAGQGFGLFLPEANLDEDLYGKVRATASKLGNRLRGVLQAETLVKDRYAKRSGKRLDRRRLTRVALDDPRIWKKPAEQVDTSGHVHVLLDTSGSMGPLMWQLAEAGLATIRAVQAVDELSASASTLPIGGSCWVVKAPHEDSMAVASRFRSMKATGGTPIHIGIQEAKPLILGGEVANRVLIIFTDGQPNCARSVQDATQELRQQGVVAGAVILGEHENQLEDFLPSRRLDSLENLPAVVTDLVATLMLTRPSAA